MGKTFSGPAKLAPGLHVQLPHHALYHHLRNSMTCGITYHHLYNKLQLGGEYIEDLSNGTSVPHPAQQIYDFLQNHQGTAPLLALGFLCKISSTLPRIVQ